MLNTQLEGGNRLWYITHATRFFGFAAEPTHKTRAMERAAHIPVHPFGVENQEPNDFVGAVNVINAKWREFVLNSVVPIMFADEQVKLGVADVDAGYQRITDSSSWAPGRKITVQCRNLFYLSKKVGEYFDQFGESDIVGKLDAAMRMGKVDFRKDASVVQTGVARVTFCLPGNPLKDSGLLSEYYSTLSNERSGMPYSVPVGIDVPSVLAFLHKSNKLQGVPPADLVRFPKAYRSFLLNNLPMVIDMVNSDMEDGSLDEGIVRQLGVVLAFGLKDFASNSPMTLLPSMLHAIDKVNMAGGVHRELSMIPMI